MYAEIQTSEIFYNTWHTFEFYMLAGDFNFLLLPWYDCKKIEVP